MKKTEHYFFCVFCIILVTTSFSVFAQIKEKKVERSIITDCFGNNKGKEIPEWVRLVAIGNNNKVEKALGLSDKKVFGGLFEK